MRARNEIAILVLIAALGIHRVVTSEFINEINPLLPGTPDNYLLLSIVLVLVTIGIVFYVLRIGFYTAPGEDMPEEGFYYRQPAEFETRPQKTGAMLIQQGAVQQAALNQQLEANLKGYVFLNITDPGMETDEVLVLERNNSSLAIELYPIGEHLAVNWQVYIEPGPRLWRHSVLLAFVFVSALSTSVSNSLFIYFIGRSTDQELHDFFTSDFFAVFFINFGERLLWWSIIALLVGLVFYGNTHALLQAPVSQDDYSDMELLQQIFQQSLNNATRQAGLFSAAPAE